MINHLALTIIDNNNIINKIWFNLLSKYNIKLITNANIVRILLFQKRRNKLA